MTKKFSIRVADVKDNVNILEFIREHFYKEEPFTTSYVEPEQTWDDEEFTLSHIADKTVLIACDAHSKIAGVLIAFPNHQGDAEKVLKSAEIHGTKKFCDLQKFLIYIEKKAGSFEKFNVKKSLHCHALGVHRDYRGNKIGQKLFEKFFDLGKTLNYRLMTVDCTNIFSMKIAEKLGMKMISSVTYEEYNEVIGEKLFYCKEPNVAIKTFAKLL